MSLGPEIATAQIQLEVELAARQIDEAAREAAARFNQVFAQSQAALLAKSRATQSRAAKSFTDAFGGSAIDLVLKNTTQSLNSFQQSALNASNRIGASFSKITTIIGNTRSAVTFLGSSIGSRLPASMSSAGNIITGVLGNIAGTVGGLSNQFSSLFAAIGSGSAVAAAGLAALVIVAAKVGTSFAKTAGDFQELQQSLNALISNSETANTTADKFIGQLRTLALESGRSSSVLANTGRQFLALGFSGDRATEILTAFTKAAAFTGATNEQLQLTLNGVSQIASKGTVSMEELRRQIAENLPGAVNLSRFFELLGKNMGVTTEEARKLQQQGLVPAEVGIKSLVETVNEVTDGIDVFALRANTLSGTLGILRESFTQIVQTGFQPFIATLVPQLAQLNQGIQAGTGPFAGLQKQVERLGISLGESFSQILAQVVPLIPGFIELFVNLTETFGPLVVEIVKIAATFARILIPAINFVVNVIDVLLNKLGPLSFILRAITSGAIIGGAVKAFQLFGRAIGSAGGFIGRIATPLSKMLEKIADSAPIVGSATFIMGLFKDAVNVLLDIIGAGLDKLKDFVGLIGKIPGVEAAVRGVKNLAGAVGDLFDSGDKPNKIKEAIKDVGDIAPKSIDKVVVAFKALNEAFSAVVDNQEKLIDAQEKVADAQKNLGKAQGSLRDAEQDLIDTRNQLVIATNAVTALEQERLVLINDTARDIREVVDAETDLAKIGFRLLDLDRDEADILERLAKLRTPASAEEIADADRDIVRAKLALNKAIQAEQELLNRLNEEQQESVDLSGLTLDQLETRLAIARATAAAQRAQKRATESAVVTEADQIEARLDVADAQANLNKLISDRNELDQRVINNARDIEELEIRLNKLSLDRTDLLQTQSEAQLKLNGLRAGETTRAKEIQEIDEKIRDAKDKQLQASIAITNAERDVHTAALDVLEANNAVTKAKEAQRNTNIEILGTEKQINQLRLEQIAINDRIIGQAGATQTLLQAQLAAIGPALLGAFSGVLGDTGNILNPSGVNTSNILAELILNNPNKLRELLRALGVEGFKDGGLITRPTNAIMGENFRPEVVLPLTKPDRVWELLSQTLPRFPGALRAAQTAIGPSPALRQAVRSSGGNRVVRQADGPMTFSQAEQIIQLLKTNGQSTIQIEAPITMNNPTEDASLAARKLKRQIEKTLFDVRR